MYRKALQSLQRQPSRLWRLNNSRGIATSAEELNAFGKHHVTRGLGRITEGVVTKQSGSYVEFMDGRKMLDFTCGIGVTNLGHCHPKVSKAASEQCLTAVHAQCGTAFHEPYLRLIEKLIPVMPHPSLDSFFFWNSGSEAVEAAIKMARVFTGKQNIISMQGAYHGRTMGAMAVTRSKTIYSQGVAPLMPGTFSTQFPYWHQHFLPPSTPSHILTAASLHALSLLLLQQTAPSDTAAIIIEPVLGEGGYVPAPPLFLEGLRHICDKHGILLIVDEVQSGFGRTGDWFAINESKVRPDILVMAKGLANGFPLSAVVSRKELTDKLIPGSMGGTYAGNAVSCAAAGAVVDVMKDDRIFENVEARSAQLLSFLQSLQAHPGVSPSIVDVRGRGLMVGVEFASPTSPGGPHDFSKFSGEVAEGIPKNIASRVAAKCIEKGMLILTTSIYEVVRFIPPLNITEEDLSTGCEIFADSVKEVMKEG